MRIIAVVITLIWCVICYSQELISPKFIETKLEELNKVFEYRYLSSLGDSVRLESAYLLGDQIIFYFTMNHLLQIDKPINYISLINRSELNYMSNWYYRNKNKLNSEIYKKLNELWDNYIIVQLINDYDSTEEYLNEVLRFRKYIDELKLENLR